VKVRSSVRSLAFVGLVLTAILAGALSPTPWVRSAAAQGEAGEVPTTRAELFKFLQSGAYRMFARESAVHPSGGPHGRVRTYLNPILESSLKAENEAHPVKAAAVKELYSGDRLFGWAVSVKTEPDSAEGDGWYWYEVFSTSDGSRPAADGNGVSLCTGCHAGGTDYVTIPYPLQ
jgi:hypothetical protein